MISLNSSMSFYIDFDGVILDTIEQYKKVYNNNKLKRFEDIFNYINLKDIINEKYEINNSLTILRNVQNTLNIHILTKINNQDEYNAKVLFLRRNGIFIDVIGVPYYQSKVEFVEVNDKTVLIDDMQENIVEWIDAGGIGITFNEEISSLNVLYI